MLRADLQADLEAVNDFVDHRLVPRLAEAKLRHREMRSLMKSEAIVSEVQRTAYFIERGPRASTFELVLTTSAHPEKKHVSRIVVGLRAAGPGSTELYLMDGLREARAKGFVTQDQLLVSDRMQKVLLGIVGVVLLLGLPLFFWAYLFAAVVTVVVVPFALMLDRRRQRARLSKVADVFGAEFGEAGRRFA